MISRGAKKAVAVEQNPKVCAFVKEQIKKYVWNEQIEVLCEDVSVFFAKERNEKYDIVLFDPPYYENSLTSVVVTKLKNICNDGAVFVFEFASGDSFAEDFILQNYDNYDIRKYGKTSVAFVKGG
jgi:16S rRNA G966 N2-methylase RsmD